MTTSPSNKRGDAPDKNFGLTQREFDEMVHQLRNGNYQFYERVFLAHFHSCIDYVKFRCKASHTEAYDATMDAMLSLCKKLKEGKVDYGNLRYLFTRMACQHYSQANRRQFIFEGMEGVDPPEEPTDLKEGDIAMMWDAWGYLGKPCQRVLRSFYFEKTSLKRIAELEERSEAALRKQKQRCLEALRGFFVQLFNA